jgi:hypothetical protein
VAAPVPANDTRTDVAAGHLVAVGVNSRIEGEGFLAVVPPLSPAGVTLTDGVAGSGEGDHRSGFLPGVHPGVPAATATCVSAPPATSASDTPATTPRLASRDSPALARDITSPPRSLHRTLTT